MEKINIALAPAQGKVLSSDKFTYGVKVPRESYLYLLRSGAVEWGRYLYWSEKVQWFLVHPDVEIVCELLFGVLL